MKKLISIILAASVLLASSGAEALPSGFQGRMVPLATYDLESQALVQRLVDFRHCAPVISIGHLLIKHQMWAGAVVAPIALTISLGLSPHDVIGAFWHTALYTSGVFVLQAMVAWTIFGDRLTINFFGAMCGVFFSMGLESSEQQLADNEKRVEVLRRRGMQSVGLEEDYEELVSVTNGTRVPGIAVAEKDLVVTKYGVTKRWFDKREDRLHTFFEDVEDNRKDYLKKALPESDSNANPVRHQKGHTRFSTVGAKGGETVKMLTNAAHPHSVMPGKMRLRWIQGDDGLIKPTYDWLQNIFEFNGDLENLKQVLKSFKLYGRKMSNGELRPWLAKWLYVNLKDIPPGDAPTQAGLVDMFHTQGFWFPSLRYALAIHVKKDPSEDPPPQNILDDWAVLFDHLFDQYRSQIRLAPGQSFDQVDPERIEEFKVFAESILTNTSNKDKFIAQAAKNDDVVKKTLLRAERSLWTQVNGDVPKLIDAATNAFFKNSLVYAVANEIKPRFEGSVAAVISSTVNPPHSYKNIVIFAWGQPASLAFDAEGKNVSGASDRRVLQTKVEAKWRFDLDSGNGEVVWLGHDGKKVLMTLYSGKDNRVLSDADIQARLLDMHDTSQVDEFKRTNGSEKQIVEGENQRIPALLKELNEGIEDGTDKDFLQPAAEFTRVFMRNKIYSAIILGMNLNGDQLPRELRKKIMENADALSRKSWLHIDDDNFERELLESCRSLSDQFDKELAGHHLSRHSEVHLHEFKEKIVTLLNDETIPIRARINKAFMMFLRLFNPVSWITTSYSGFRRWISSPNDLIVIGTEKAHFAGRQFAKDFSAMEHLRVRSVVSNDFLTEATRILKGDPDRVEAEIALLQKKYNIDPNLTVLFITSETAETFDTELATQLGVRLAKEVFVMTGGKDNRMADLVGRNRTFYFHNPVSMEETHLAAYLAMNHAFTRLLIFVGENIAHRFKSKVFFNSEWTVEQFKQVRASIAQLINKTVGDLLGYDTDQKLHPTAASEALNEQGRYFSSVSLEGVRIKWVGLFYLFLTVTLLQKGAAALVLSGLVAVTGPHIDAWLQIMSHFGTFTAYASVGALAIVGIRMAFKLFDRPIPALLADLGQIQWRNLVKGLFVVTLAAKIIPIAVILGGHLGIHIGSVAQMLSRFGDFAIYAAMGTLIPLMLRLVLKLLGRPTPSLLVGFGTKSFLFVDSFEYVSDFIPIFGRKAFAMAYSILAPIIEGVKTEYASDYRAPMANRRGYLVIGLPDGRFPALKILESTALMLGKHTKSILSLPWRWMQHIPVKSLRTPISPNVLMIGSKDKGEVLTNDNAFHRNIVYEVEEPLPTDVPEHIALFYGSRIDAFRRLVANGRIISTWAQEVSRQAAVMGIKFPVGRTHPNTGAKTTAGPVLGDAIIALLPSIPVQVERIGRDREPRSTPNPFVVLEHPLPAMDEDLRDTRNIDADKWPTHLDPRAPTENPQATRPAPSPYVLHHLSRSNAGGMERIAPSIRHAMKLGHMILMGLIVLIFGLSIATFVFDLDLIHWLFVWVHHFWDVSQIFPKKSFSLGFILPLRLESRSFRQIKEAA